MAREELRGAAHKLRDLCTLVVGARGKLGVGEVEAGGVKADAERRKVKGQDVVVCCGNSCLQQFARRV